MTTPVTPSLFVTPSTRTVAYTANSSTTVSLTATVSWTAVSSQTWLTVAPASGTTGTTLTVTATSVNPTTNPRSATVTITGGGLPPSTVTVTQDGAPVVLPLTLAPTSSNIGFIAASGLSFAVAATGTWSTVSNQSWATVTTPSGSGDGTVLFNVTENQTADLRAAVITVTGNGQTAVFNLNQQASTVVDDHGNSIATATPIASQGGGATGVLTASDDDYFRVTVPGPGILIAWTEGPTDTYGYLYNATSAKLDEDDSSDRGLNFRVSSDVVAGNYYIRVRGGLTSTVGPYALFTRFILSSAPIQCTYLEKSGNDVSFGFSNISGVTYYVQTSADLETWTDITSVTGVGGEMLISLVGEMVQRAEPEGGPDAVFHGFRGNLQDRAERPCVQLGGKRLPSASSSPVGSFAPNGYGLYDMTGNMSEWCWDWYGDYVAGSPANPRGAVSGRGRAFRGGGWNSIAGYCRLASRSNNYPESLNNGRGFRVARSSVP